MFAPPPQMQDPEQSLDIVVNDDDCTQSPRDTSPSSEPSALADRHGPHSRPRERRRTSLVSVAEPEGELCPAPVASLFFRAAWFPVGRRTSAARLNGFPSVSGSRAWSCIVQRCALRVIGLPFAGKSAHPQPASVALPPTTPEVSLQLTRIENGKGQGPQGPRGRRAPAARFRRHEHGRSDHRIHPAASSRAAR